MNPRTLVLSLLSVGALAGCSVLPGAVADDATPASAAVASVAVAPAEAATEEARWEIPGASDELVTRAQRAWERASARGEVTKPVVTLIDYARPSSEPRLWVYDVERGEVLFHELVSHGKGSGELRATAFSNVVDSKQTSLGVFRTAETYVGKHGRSLRLDGLEPGFNDRARERAIVIHGADYVSEAFVEQNGRLGLSWGCPALSQDVAQEVIDTIADGSLVVAYGDDAEWLGTSEYVGDPAG